MGVRWAERDISQGMSNDSDQDHSNQSKLNVFIVIISALTNKVLSWTFKWMLCLEHSKKKSLIKGISLLFLSSKKAGIMECWLIFDETIVMSPIIFEYHLDIWKLLCSSCHIRSVLIGVKYQNWRQTWDVYLLFAILLGQIY